MGSLCPQVTRLLEHNPFIPGWVLSGKKIFDDNCRPIVNNSQNVRAYTFLKELAKYSPPDIGAYAWAEVEGSLVSEKLQ